MSSFTGVLVAAGRGRRLGGMKQLHEVNGQPLIAAAHDSIMPACADIVVVLGHEHERVTAALRPRDVDIVLADPDAPMLDSIRAGVMRALELAPGRSILLQPGDHPDVQAETLTKLTEVASTNPLRVIVPEFAGRGGHPIVLPPSLVEELLGEHPDGLRGALHDAPHLMVRVPVDDPGVQRNVNEPGD